MSLHGLAEEPELQAEDDLSEVGPEVLKEASKVCTGEGAPSGSPCEPQGRRVDESPTYACLLVAVDPDVNHGNAVLKALGAPVHQREPVFQYEAPPYLH